MPTNGDWLVPLINQYDFTNDITGAGPLTDMNKSNEPPNQNVGVKQYNAGPYSPSLTVEGLRKRSGTLTLSAFDYLMVTKGAVGSAADQELIISMLMGINGSPAVGDWAFLMDATGMDYSDSAAPSDNLKFAAQFKPRGLRGGWGRLLAYQTAAATGTITSAFLDRGTAASAGTTKGLTAHLHCQTPSALQATGTFTLSGLPADGDTVTVGGVVYTFKTALTPTAGQVLIGATVAATQLNLWQAMYGALQNKAVSYATGTTGIPATIFAAKPTTGVMTFTAVTGGTAGNALTLAKSGTNLAVSAATLTGGTAGDSYVVTLSSATTSGGAYTTFGTFVSTLQAAGGERLEIAAGVTINEFIKAAATTGGSTSTPKFAITICPYWQ